ncbi:MAG: hypothetical protein JNJ51_04515 [Methylobacillus glycogenes]|nr:hypothetical protein [Methylobacillus glycogenes]
MNYVDLKPRQRLFTPHPAYPSAPEKRQRHQAGSSHQATECIMEEIKKK